MLEPEESEDQTQDHLMGSFSRFDQHTVDNSQLPSSDRSPILLNWNVSPLTLEDPNKNLLVKVRVCHMMDQPRSLASELYPGLCGELEFVTIAFGHTEGLQAAENHTRSSLSERLECFGSESSTPQIATHALAAQLLHHGCIAYSRYSSAPDLEPEKA